MVSADGQPETKGTLLTRDDFISGRHIEALIASGSIDPVDLNPVEVRMRRMREMIAASPGPMVWVFAYGSLIWNPAFDYDERCIGHLHGYHRRYCFWSYAGRGTPDRPGMMLGLDRGGSCKGLLLGVSRERADEELTSVFMRELTGLSYHARLLKVRTAPSSVEAITFVANQSARNYSGRVPLPEAAAHIAQASGHLGSCTDYLVNTIQHLKAWGISDRDLDLLKKLVENSRSP